MTAGRELRALQAAGEAFPDARKLLLTLYRDGIPSALPADVAAKPVYAWALGGSAD